MDQAEWDPPGGLGHATYGEHLCSDPVQGFSAVIT